MELQENLWTLVSPVLRLMDRSVLCEPVFKLSMGPEGLFVAWLMMGLEHIWKP